MLYRLRGSYDHALNDLYFALRLHPKDHLIYNEIGECFMAQEEYKKAIRSYLKTIKYNNKVDPFEKLNNGMIYQKVARCYEKLGNNKKAEKYFKKA